MFYGQYQWMVAEFSYRLWENTKCVMSGISNSGYRDQIEKLINKNYSMRFWPTIGTI